MLSDAGALLLKPTVSTALVSCVTVLVAYVMLAKSKADKSWAVAVFSRELLGSVVMVFCGFTPGPFLGHFGGWEEWTAHFGGILLTDYIFGGHFNPAVSFAFFVHREISLAQLFVLWAAQMAGGVLAFPLLQACSSPYGIEIGGPAVAEGVSLEQAMWAEFAATFLLLAAVFTCCTTWLGPHWAFRQSLIAVSIRCICVLNGGATGPAMNPMLATTWALFKHHGHESFPPLAGEHYLVYWVASVGGALAFTTLWSLVWAGGLFSSSDKSESPTTVEQAWAAHLKHFETLNPEDKEDPSWAKILLDYEDDATLVMSILTDDEKDNGKSISMAPSKKGKKGVLVYLQSTRTESDKEQADEVIVDEATRSVFLKWHSATSAIHGTDTYFFSDQFKIARQHTTMSQHTTSQRGKETATAR